MTTILLDASAMRESSCILRLYHKVVQGYTKIVQPNDLVFGSAFHCFAKVKDETGDEMTALAEAVSYYRKTPKYIKPKKEYLDENYLTSTCLSLSSAFTPDIYDIVRFDNGKPFVEQRIAYPYYVTPERDIEVVLCGTLDKLMFNRVAGFYVISDYKTTSLWNSQQYFEIYSLSTQLMMYKLLLTLYAKLLPEVSLLQKVSTQPLGCLIEGVFIQPSKSARFERSEVYWFSQEKMEEFERGLHLFIQEKLVPAIRAPNERLYREGILNGSCERVFGRCDFAGVCESEGERRDEILNEEFGRMAYNPLTHGDVKV